MSAPSRQCAEQDMGYRDIPAVCSWKMCFCYSLNESLGSLIAMLTEKYNIDSYEMFMLLCV